MLIKNNYTGNKERSNVFLNITQHTNTNLYFSDQIKHLFLRLGINRDKASINTGIYAVGNPSKASPVFVSANYLMSFNYLRSSLKNIDAWIMVIDTKGINVWCAAGKGTFGTEEIARCINKFNLDKVVEHKEIIVPQLAASGVSSFEIKKLTGFKVIYGPVESKDILQFINAGYKATKEMRKIKFNLWNRVVLIPVELTLILKYLIPVSILLYFISTTMLYGLLLSVFSGIVLTPILLPYIPVRSFILKGWFTGLFVEVLFFAYSGNLGPLITIGGLLLFSAISSYLAFNFTGCTTFTSPSGVQKELEKYIKPLIYSAGAGLIIICFHIVRSLI